MAGAPVFLRRDENGRDLSAIAGQNNDMRFHLLSRLLRARPGRLRLSMAALACACFAPAALAGGEPRARLVAGAPAPDGDWRGAVVLELPPGALTYWRNPGDAGVAPVFDFSASRGIDGLRLAMPAPRRLQEAGSEVFGWTDRVAFFVTGKPGAGAARGEVRLRVDYAICEKLCLPARADLALDLGKPAADADAKIVDAAQAALPRPVAAAQAGALAPDPAGADGKPAWIFRPAAAASDLFPEAPDGYFFETRKLEDGAFRIVLAQAPADASASPALRLTLDGPQGAREFTLAPPTSAPAR